MARSRLLYLVVILIVFLYQFTTFYFSYENKPLGDTNSLNHELSNPFSLSAPSILKDIYDIAFSPDESIIAVGHHDYTVSILNATSYEPIKSIGYELSWWTGQNNPVAFSPNGSILASGYLSSILLWNTSAWKNFLNLSITDSHLDDVAFSPDGSLLAGIFGSINLWNISNAFSLLPMQQLCKCIQGDFTFDSNRIITINTNGVNQVNIEIWNRSTLGLITKYSEHTASVRALTVSKFDDIAITSGYDGVVRVWNTSDLSTIKVIQDHTDQSVTLAVSKDHQYIAFNGFQDIILYSLITNSLVGNITGISGFDDSVTTLEFHPTMNQLLLGNDEGTIQIFSLPGLNETSQKIFPYLVTTDFSLSSYIQENQNQWYLYTNITIITPNGTYKNKFSDKEQEGFFFNMNLTKITSRFLYFQTTYYAQNSSLLSVEDSIWDRAELDLAINLLQVLSTMIIITDNTSFITQHLPLQRINYTLTGTTISLNKSGLYGPDGSTFQEQVYNRTTGWIMSSKGIIKNSTHLLAKIEYSYLSEKPESPITTTIQSSTIPSTSFESSTSTSTQSSSTQNSITTASVESNIFSTLLSLSLLGLLFFKRKKIN